MAATGPKDDLDDLIDFLMDKRPSVKLAALDIILGLTASPEGLEKLKHKTGKLLVFMLRLIADSDKEVSNKTLSSLVNMAHDKDFVAALVKQNVVNRCMDYLRDQTCEHPRLLIMLLNNLTASSEEACTQLLQLGHEKLQGLNMAILIKRFVMSGLTFEPGQEDNYEHVAPILTNVTQFKPARAMLLQPGRGTLQALAAQLRAPTLCRRQGVAGAIKNCCMSAEGDGTLEQVVSDPAVLAAMLTPISGAEPKEKDDHVRACMAESVMVLASTDKGREALKKANAEELLRKGYEYEVNPTVCHAMEHAAEYFLATHGQQEEGEDQQQGERTKQSADTEQPVAS